VNLSAKSFIKEIVSNNTKHIQSLNLQVMLTSERLKG